MSKKNKKKPQQNLSLKDRLGKHWNNRNWGAFVSLYTRDREASMRTPWAERWQDALYNCLTSSFFVEKDFQVVEMTLDVIRGEGDELSPGLCDCADVVSDFMTARKTAVLTEPSPLRKAMSLPLPYRCLRQEFAALVSAASKVRKSKKDEAVLLVEKLAAQFIRLEKAKSVSPWSTWLKIAEQLEVCARGMDCADIFCAIRAIGGLLYELARGARGKNDLSDVANLPEHPLFCAVPPNQSHPVIGMLWNFFCRMGERKYGAEWSAMARVLQLSFMAGTGRLEQLKKQYDRLMNSDAEPNDLLWLLLSKAYAWTEQEQYMLRMFFVSTYDPDTEEDTRYSVERFEGFLGSFEILGRLGRRWRPQAPWAEPVRKCFEEMILEIPPGAFFAMLELDIPWEAVPAVPLLRIVLHERGKAEKLRKLVSSRLPFSLSSEEIKTFVGIFEPGSLTAEDARLLKLFLSGAGYTELFTRWVRQAIVDTGQDALHGVSPSQQMWKNMKGDLLEVLAETLPPNSLEACLCALISEGGKYRLAEDPSKTENFFGVLAARVGLSRDEDKELGEPMLALLMFLITWPDVEPSFLLRLFDVIFPYHEKAARHVFMYWEKVATLVSGMVDRINRRIVAAGFRKRMERTDRVNKTRGFEIAVASLQSLEGPDSPESSKEEKTSPQEKKPASRGRRKPPDR
ncbi:MAG: hypothetical protein LBQ90_02705 [Synergistaceae bacterium]|jgi:hypothetical protein|nr:hypothetical protein [Synergistaceae bacterium]